MLRFIEHFFCGSRYCGTKVCGFFCGSATATSATERLFEALRVNNVEVLSVEDLLLDLSK